MSTFSAGLVNVAKPKPDIEMVAVLSATLKSPFVGFVIWLVLAVHVIVKGTSENAFVPSLPLPVAEKM